MSRPLPSDVLADPVDLPFWEAANRGEFLLHRCSVCGRQYWPASGCVEHGAESMQWTPASGLGTVHTYTVVRRQYHPAFPPPYAVAVVRLDEGPFYHTNVICEPSRIHVGQRVRACFKEIAPSVRLPFFRPLAVDDLDQKPE